MDTNELRSVRSLRVCLGLLLIGLVFYPGIVMSPYIQTYDPIFNNQIIDNDTEVEALGVGEDENPYHSLTTRHPQLNDDGSVKIGETDVYQYTELDSKTREIFDRARTAEDQEFELTVCKEWVLICDEYRQSDIPDEFTYEAVGQGIDQTPIYIVKTENQAYLLRTGSPGHGDGANLAKAGVFVISRLILLLIAASVLYYAVRPPDSDSVYSFNILLGISIGALAFLAPYLHMIGIEVGIVWRIIALTPAIVLVNLMVKIIKVRLD